MEKEHYIHILYNYQIYLTDLIYTSSDHIRFKSCHKAPFYGNCHKCLRTSPKYIPLTRKKSILA